MSLYSALPYLSAAAAALALWQAAVQPDGWAGRLLRTAALGLLAAYAFGRGTAPSTLAAALVLSTLAHLIPPKEDPQWRKGSDWAALLAALAYAYLFFKDGPGLASSHDPAHLPLLAVAAAAAAALLAFGLRLAPPRRRIKPATGEPAEPGVRRPPGADLEAGGFALMVVAAATMRFDHWPAMLGVVTVIAGEMLAATASPEQPAARWRPPAHWLLIFCGHAAIAYAFMR